MANVSNGYIINFCVTYIYNIYVSECTQWIEALPLPRRTQAAELWHQNMFAAGMDYLSVNFRVESPLRESHPRSKEDQGR